MRLSTVLIGTVLIGTVPIGTVLISTALIGTSMTLAAAAATPPAGASAADAHAGNGDQFAPLTLTASSARIPLEKSKSTAGYISAKSGIKTVSATFEVPEITNCTSSENTGMGPVVILVGKNYFVGAGAEAECQSGTTSYLIAINHNGTETHPLTVSAKDKISVQVTIGSKNVEVKIEDLTTGHKTSQALSKRKVTDAEFGDDSLSEGSKQVPIPKFTDHEFSSAKVNGKVLRDASPLLDEELVKGKTVLIKAGAFNKAGDSFTMLFEHAS